MLLVPIIVEWDGLHITSINVNLTAIVDILTRRVDIVNNGPFDDVRLPDINYILF